MVQRIRERFASNISPDALRKAAMLNGTFHELGVPEELEPYFTAFVAVLLPLLVVACAPAAAFYFRRLLVEIAILGKQLNYFFLTDCGSPASWPWVQSELRALLRIEANRRLHPMRMARMKAPPNPVRRLLLGAPKPAPSMPMGGGGGGMIFKDLVLIGGGHAHAHVLKMFGMRPEAGVQLTLITRDVDTPYSGMLPGYVAGSYTWRECHIDLVKLAAFANARVIHAEACGLDTGAKRVHLNGRPPIAYDVLSIDIGSAPKPVEVKPEGGAPAAGGKEESALPPTPPPTPPVNRSSTNNALLDSVGALGAAAGKLVGDAPKNLGIALQLSPPPAAKEAKQPEVAAPASAAPSSAITPVKPIDGFCRRWDAILARVLALPEAAVAKIVVVGGGAGGVELALSMHARLTAELTRAGRKPATNLRVTLVGRSAELMPQHPKGVRSIFERIFADRGVVALTNTSIAYATSSALVTTDGVRLEYDEAIWCTQGGAQEWLRATSLALDAGGFIAVHPSLESTNTPDVFACGDVAAVLDYPRPKAGVFAVRQGPPLTDNLRHRLRGEPTAPFVPQSTFLGLIGAGDGQCVASRERISTDDLMPLYPPSSRAARLYGI